MPNPPRPQFNPDLSPAPQIQPTAQSRDTYTRPGTQEYGIPAKENGLTQLSNALAHLEPALRQYQTDKAVKQTEADVAKAREIHLGPTRDAFGQLVDKGEIARGVNPFVGKMVDRLQLDQQGRQMRSEMQQAFHSSPDFLQARASNSPDALNEAMQKFQGTWESQHGLGAHPENPKIGDPYNTLDVQEKYLPHVDQGRHDLLSTWTQYRIKERESDAVATTGGLIGDELERFAGTGAQHDEDGGVAAYKKLAGTLENFGSHYEDGAVSNGALSRTEYNDLVADGAVAMAVKTGDPSVLRVLDHMPTNNGKNSLSQIPKIAAKVAAAQEHIVNQKHQAMVVTEFAANTQQIGRAHV